MSTLELFTSVELGLIYGIAAIGIYLSFRIIDFPDLTCDGSFVLGAAVAATALKAGYNSIAALFLAAFMGGIAGLITGILHTYFKIKNLLAGILTAFMLYSINLKVMRGMPNIALIDLPTIFDTYNPVLILLLVVAAICMAVSFILSTDIGLALRSVGQNQRLASNYGVQIAKMTVLGLVLSNVLIAISGALFSLHQGFADVSQGLGTVIVGFAAVMIGEKLIPTRAIWLAVLACVFGSILYRILIALALHSEWLGIETQDLNIITGLLIIAIMAIPSLRMFKKNA